MVRIIQPTPDADDQFFWDGVAEHRLLLQSCGDCGVIRHPPLPMCGECQSLATTTTESTGRGTVYSWIVSVPPNHNPSNTDSEEARVVALIDLDEGVRFVCNVAIENPDDMRVGLPVSLFFADFDGTTLPQFRVADDAERSGKARA